MPNSFIPFWDRRQYLFFGGQQPFAPRTLPPSITNVPRGVPNPIHPGRLIATMALAAAAWASAADNANAYEFTGGRQPFDQARLPPAITNLPAGNPPFVNEGRSPWLDPIESGWFQLPDQDLSSYRFIGGRQPFAPRTLAPSILNVPPGVPVFAHRGRTIEQASSIALAWQPPDPSPTLLAKLVPQAVAAFVPYSNGWVSAVLGTWQPPDPQPTLLRVLPASVTAVPLGIPNPEHPERTLVQSQVKPWIWYADPWWDGAQKGGAQPYSPTTKLVPQAVVAFVPSSLSQQPSILTAWQPSDQPPALLRYLPASVTAVPLGVPNPEHPERTLAQSQATAFGSYPDPWWPGAQQGAAQPYSARQIIGAIPPVVTPLIPSSRIWLSTVLSSWQPPDPLPTLPRNLYSDLLNVPAGNPPFSVATGVIVDPWFGDQPLPTLPAKLVPQAVVTSVPYAPGWLSAVLAAWQPPDPLPTLPRNLYAGLLNVPASNPPFPRNLDPLDPIILSTWQPLDPPPTLPAKLVPIAAVSQVPIGQPWLPGVLASWQQATWQPIALSPISAISPTQNPYPTWPWLPTILSSWQPPDPLPTLPRNIYAGLLNVPAANPPFSDPGRLSYLNSVLELWWRAPDPLPTMPRILPASLVAVAINNPQFVHPERTITAAEIKSIWQPSVDSPEWRFTGGRQPLDQARLPPQLIAVPLGQPMPNQDALAALITILGSWQPPDPQPTLNVKLIPIPPSFYVPYSLAWTVGVIQSWQPPDPPPTLPKLNSPGIPGQSNDPPPFIHRERAAVVLQGSVVLSQPDPWVYSLIGGRQPYEPRKAAPGTPGFSLDNPPPRQPWAWLNPLVLSWQPPDPPPTLPRNLYPAALNVPVSNPPFDMRGRTLPSVIDAWQPEPFVFRPPYVPTARFIQPFLGARIIAKPRKTGQDAQASLAGNKVATTLKGLVEDN